MFRRLLQIASLAALSGLAVAPAGAGPVLLYETGSDRVLYAEDADQPWYAASLTKMMTAYLVFEAWKEKRVTPEQMIKISAKANAQPKMRLGLGKDKEISFEHAIKALVIVSANDIAYAIAEALGGTEEGFVTAMNAKAEKLGMTGTRFINAHGLPGEGQHTTAQDMARLSSALMRDYPEHMHYFALAMTEIGEKKKRVIATHNPALIHVEGGDGFKTGFTCSAGYNIVASASRNGRRLIAIILGEKTSGKRSAKAQVLIEYGFKMLEWKLTLPAPTIHSMPGGQYDRTKAVAANLDQRLKDCRDPDPTPELIAKLAKKNPKAAKAMQERLDALLKERAEQVAQGEVDPEAEAQKPEPEPAKTAAQLTTGTTRLTVQTGAASATATATAAPSAPALPAITPVKPMTAATTGTPAARTAPAVPPSAPLKVAPAPKPNPAAVAAVPPPAPGPAQPAAKPAAPVAAPPAAALQPATAPAASTKSASTAPAPDTASAPTKPAAKSAQKRKPQKRPEEDSLPFSLTAP